MSRCPDYYLVMRIVALMLLVVGCDVAPDVVMTRNAPVTIYKAPSLQRRDLKGKAWSYCGSEKYRQSVRQAVQWWSERGSGIGEEVPCNELMAGAPIEIFDVTSEIGMTTDGQTAMAAYFPYDNYHQINLYRDFSYETVDAQLTILKHEIGHLLGFSHAENPSCVMHNGFFTPDKELCREEIAALAKP